MNAEAGAPEEAANLANAVAAETIDEANTEARYAYAESAKELEQEARDTPRADRGSRGSDGPEGASRQTLLAQAEPGLADYLALETEPGEVVQACEFSDPALKAGPGGDPGGADTVAMACIAAGDTAAWSAEILRLDQTTAEQARAGIEALRRLPRRPTGLVATGATGAGATGYSYYSRPYGHDSAGTAA